MLLGARILSGVASVNIFDYVDSARFTEGDVVDLYFQIVDLNVEANSYQVKGRRYMPSAVAAPLMTVSFGSIDDAKKINRVATQPFSQDPSIWKVSLLATDILRGTMDMRLTLTETVSLGPTVTKVTRGVVRQAIAADSQITSY